jgi:hypothetical protein
MRLAFRSFVSSVVCLGLSAFFIAAAFAQADPGLGVWRLNVAKSTYSPGPAPKSATTTITAAGAGVKVVVDQVFADGPRHWEYTANNDGKDVAVTGNNPDADMIARTRINATTVQTVLKKAGKVTVTQTSVVSSDGKTRTVTVKGVSASGQKVSNVAVYEKQ